MKNIDREMFASLAITRLRSRNILEKVQLASLKYSCGTLVFRA